MKKLFLLLAAAAMTFSVSAQTVEESNSADNVYIGIYGGVATKATGVKWLDNLNPNASLRIGRWFTPVFGLAVDGTAYFNNKPYLSTGTVVCASNVSLLGTVNLTNWFGGYKGEPRCFEVAAFYGLGWGHLFTSKHDLYEPTNRMTSKAGVDLTFNFGSKKQWQFVVEPSFTWAFLGQKQQLNYRPIAVCPIRLDPATGLVEADTNIEGLNKQINDVLGSSIPIMTYGDDFAEHAVSLHAQTVMVTDVMQRFSDNFNTFALSAESMNLEIALVTSAADVSGHETQVRVIQGTTVMTICLPQYSPAAMLQKRVFDIAVSSVALVVIAIVTIPVAVAIKVTDGGPIFYRQTRVGRRGKLFKMVKFRSMVVNADELKADLAEQTGQQDRFIFKMENDPRITTIGRFIRRFSIDELPQFWNVLMGDMSVVGPRPPLPEEVARYDQTYATRMLVKPGITGPWQVSGRSNLTAEESEALDVGYVQSWSLLGDIVLLLRTFGAVITRNGAY